MEHGFFDQETPGVPSGGGFAAEDGVGPELLEEDLGGGKPDFRSPEPLSHQFSQRIYPEGWKKTWSAAFHTPSLVGRRIEAPLGGVPPPNVFGVWSVAVRKGVWKNKALRFEFS